MEETFRQKLKRVKFKDFCHIFLFIVALPVSIVYRCFRKDLWLICDNENEARDNGYWLFKYIVENHPEQDIVYAINKKSPDFNKVKNLGNTVNYGTLKHWILYLTAKKNISSQKGGKPNAAVCYFLEVNRILKNTRIFLQHGIIKDDMPFLHFENTQMKMFICSTDREWRFVSEKYGYPKGYVKKLGLCRFDMLHDNMPIKQNQVLVMPTWRSWIGTPTSDSYKIENISDFKNTEYFKAWNGFLGNKEVHRILKENNLKMIFYPHRDMQSFINDFNIDDENIIIAKWPEYDVQQLLKESAYLITDFSSIAMDFAYMKKRLTYYQFDYETFRQGHYPEGYFSYENDGFGKVCYTLDEVLSEFKSAVSENFVNKPEYLKRHKEFFDVYDSNNCERNYLAIREV